MENKKKTNYWLIAGVLAILIIMGYYSYKSDVKWRKNGIYSIAYVTKIRLARGGWRTWIEFEYMSTRYKSEGIYFYEYFDSKSVGKKYFVKFLKNNPAGESGLIPTIQVPDSIQSAPPEGWSEEWMREHFPKVVEYIHDTR